MRTNPQELILKHSNLHEFLSQDSAHTLCMSLAIDIAPSIYMVHCAMQGKKIIAPCHQMHHYNIRAIIFCCQSRNCGFSCPENKSWSSSFVARNKRVGKTDPRILLINWWGRPIISTKPWACVPCTLMYVVMRDAAIKQHYSMEGLEPLSPVKSANKYFLSPSRCSKAIEPCMKWAQALKPNIIWDGNARWNSIMHNSTRHDAGWHNTSQHSSTKKHEDSWPMCIKKRFRAPKLISLYPVQGRQQRVPIDEFFYAFYQIYFNFSCSLRRQRYSRKPGIGRKFRPFWLSPGNWRPDSHSRVPLKESPLFPFLKL